MCSSLLLLWHLHHGLECYYTALRSTFSSEKNLAKTTLSKKLAKFKILQHPLMIARGCTGPGMLGWVYYFSWFKILQCPLLHWCHALQHFINWFFVCDWCVKLKDFHWTTTLAFADTCNLLQRNKCIFPLFVTWTLIFSYSLSCEVEPLIGNFYRWALSLDLDGSPS